ncbi:MAG: hypothetical protein PHN45_00825 [Methylococcales bacterium]|nr:hypothetical protein [Methylococcales bacterium]
MRGVNRVETIHFVKQCSHIVSEDQSMTKVDTVGIGRMKYFVYESGVMTFLTGFHVRCGSKSALNVLCGQQCVVDAVRMFCVYDISYVNDVLVYSVDGGYAYKWDFHVLINGWGLRMSQEPWNLDFGLELYRVLKTEGTYWSSGRLIFGVLSKMKKFIFKARGQREKQVVSCFGESLNPHSWLELLMYGTIYALQDRMHLYVKPGEKGDPVRNMIIPLLKFIEMKESDSKTWITVHDNERYSVFNPFEALAYMMKRGDKNHGITIKLVVDV